MKPFAPPISKIVALFSLLFSIFSLNNIQAQSCTIAGDTSVCQGEVSHYSSPAAGDVYQWNAYNGIVSGFGPSITVNWDSPGTGELTLVVKDNLNQVVCTQSVNVVVHKLPQPAIQPSYTTSCNNEIDTTGENPNGEKEERNPCLSVCDSTWITYSTNDNPGSTYTWNITGGATVIPSTSHEIDVMWTGTGTGEVEVIETDSNYCQGSHKICVEILPKPVAAISSLPAASGGVIMACKDQPIQFINNSNDGGGSPLWSYQWIFGDGSSETLDASTSSGNTTHSYSSGGVYDVMLIVENECHCKDTAFVTVEASSLPGPNIECVSTVCPGSTVTYTTDASCPSYTWTATNGTILGSSTSSEVTVEWGTSAPAYLTLSTPGCTGTCSSPTTVEIPVITPTADIHGPQQVCLFECATYSIDCNIPIDSIAWHFPPGVNVQTDTINEHEVKVCFYDGSFTGGTIEVEYFHETPGSTNDLSCGGTATLDIQARPKLFLNYPAEICDSTTLIGSHNSSPSGDIEWTITDGAGTTTFLSTIEPANTFFQPSWVYGTGTFKITAEDLSGNYCNAPQSFILTVNELPAPPDSITGPDPVCPDVPYQYYAFSSSANYAVQWNFVNGSPAQNVGQSASVVWDNGTSPYVIAVSQSNPLTGCKSGKYLDTIASILPLAPSVISGNDTVCANGQQNYSTSSPGDDFIWTISPSIAGSVVSGQHGQDIVVEWNNYTGAATLSLERVACGKSIVTDYMVWVIAPPAPVLSVPTDACQGVPVTMTASASGATFSWDFGDGNTASGNSATHTFNAAGNHVVTVEASYSGYCTGTATATNSIMINPKPNITISTPDPNIFCGAPEPVNMHVASPVTSTSYDWFTSSSGTSLTSGTTFTANALGSYFVVGQNSFGCIDTSNYILIDTNCTDPCTPKAGSFVDFARTRLSCNLDTFEGTYSSWASSPVYDFDDPYSGSNFASGPDASHTFTEPGFYRVSLCVKVPNHANTDSCVICETKTDTIQYIPGFVDSIFCMDNSDSVRVKFINDTKVLSTAPMPTYQWTINSGSVVSTAENPVMAFTPGTYIITLIVNGVCEISHTIEIDDLPDATIMANDSVCVDAPLQFSPAVSGSILSSEWDFGDGATSLVNAPVKTYQAAGTYIVSLHLTNSYGCTDASDTTVTILPNTLLAPINALSDTVFCENDSVQIQSMVSGGYPGYDYLWSTIETSPDIWAKYTGLYYLEVMDDKGCYQRSNQIGVMVNPVPKPNIKGKTTVCYQEQEVFAVNYPSGQYDIEWSLNGTVLSWITQNKYNFFANTIGTHVISVKVSSPDTCIGYDTIHVDVVPNPNVAITAPSTLCAGEEHLLVGSTTSPGIVSNFWNTGLTNDSLFTSQSGQYTYTVVDSLGCSASTSKPVFPLPDFCGLLTGCYEICDTISSLVWHAPQGYKYQWLYNSTPIAGSIHDTLNVPLYQSGQYQVILTTAQGCSDTSDVIDIQFIPCTGCDIEVSDTIYCGPVDENGYQTYTVEFEISNGFGPGTFVNIYSTQGSVTGITPTTIPLGTSTITATFTDTPPVNDSVCFNVTLTYNNERCNVMVCSELPECGHACEFDIFSSCAHCESDTINGTNYSIEITVENNFGSNADLSVLPIPGGTFGTITPNPVPPGLTTVNIPFTDSGSRDSIICFTVLMEVNGRTCADDICVYLPDCDFTGIFARDNKQTLWLYPNPADATLNVKGSYDPGAELRVISLEGNVLQTMTTSTTETVIDIQSLAPGAYLIQVEDKGVTRQSVFMKK